MRQLGRWRRSNAFAFLSLACEGERGSPKTTTTTKALAASGGLSPSFLAPVWIKADREEEEEDALGEGREGARLIG